MGLPSGLDVDLAALDQRQEGGNDSRVEVLA
jgi:hypothetical protein